MLLRHRRGIEYDRRKRAPDSVKEGGAGGGGGGRSSATQEQQNTLNRLKSMVTVRLLS